MFSHSCVEITLNIKTTSHFYNYYPLRNVQVFMVVVNEQQRTRIFLAFNSQSTLKMVPFLTWMTT